MESRLSEIVNNQLFETIENLLNCSGQFSRRSAKFPHMVEDEWTQFFTLKFSAVYIALLPIQFYNFAIYVTVLPFRFYTLTVTLHSLHNRLYLQVDSMIL